MWRSVRERSEDIDKIAQTRRKTAGRGRSPPAWNDAWSSPSTCHGEGPDRSTLPDISSTDTPDDEEEKKEEKKQDLPTTQEKRVRRRS